MNIRTSKMLQIIALAAVTTISSGVWAQQQRNGRGGGFSRMMSGGGMTPDYMIRDLPRFQAALDLGKEQVMIVEQILRDYDESFKEATDASREGIGNAFRSMRGNDTDPARQQLEETRNQLRQIRAKLDAAKKIQGEEGIAKLQARLRSELETLRGEMRQARVEQWQSPQRQAAFEEVALFMQDQLRLKRKMRNDFESDLITILTEEQQALWPPLDRQLIRDRLLPLGRLSGESLDVIGLVQQQNYGDELLATLVPVLSEWDTNVTAALTKRDNHMVENQGELMAAMRTMEINSGLEVMREQARLSEAIRGINDASVQEIVLLLPEDKQQHFENMAKERGYPRIFRVTLADRGFQSAMEIEGLEPDILLAITELYDAFQIELAYANEKIYEATHRWEAQEDLDRMNRFAQRMTGGSAEQIESPIRVAEKDRRATEERYLEQLKLLLTEEQIESMTSLLTKDSRENRPSRGIDERRNQRRGNFEGGRDEFMKQFDKNGDGTIDDKERESIREYFRNEGGGSQSQTLPPPRRP